MARKRPVIRKRVPDSSMSKRTLPQAGFDGEVDNAGGAWAHPLRQ